MKYEFDNLAKAILHIPENNTYLVNTTCRGLKISGVDKMMSEIEPLKFTSFDGGRILLQRESGLVGETLYGHAFATASFFGLEPHIVEAIAENDREGFNVALLVEDETGDEILFSTWVQCGDAKKPSEIEKLHDSFAHWIQNNFEFRFAVAN